MSKFALSDVPEIVGDIKIFKLLIDGYCQYDEFCTEVKKNGNMTSHYKAIIRTLNDVSNGVSLPYQKFHPLKNAENQYEAKKELLRIYLIKDYNCYIIVLGSFKGNQDTDTDKMNNIYKNYINSK